DVQDRLVRREAEAVREHHVVDQEDGLRGVRRNHEDPLKVELARSVAFATVGWLAAGRRVREEDRAVRAAHHVIRTVELLAAEMTRDDRPPALAVVAREQARRLLTTEEAALRIARHSIGDAGGPPPGPRP